MQDSNNQPPLYAVPGMELGEQGNFSLGSGCYSSHRKVYASLLGRVVISEETAASDSPPQVSIQPVTPNQSTYKLVPCVGDTVIGKVFKVTWRVVIVEIFASEDGLFRYPFRGVIRLADVTTTTFSDKIDLHNCFHTGDIVRAQVISLGDPQAYYLSTCRPCDGVIYTTTMNSNSNSEVTVQ